MLDLDLSSVYWIGISHPAHFQPPPERQVIRSYFVYKSIFVFIMKPGVNQWLGKSERILFHISNFVFFHNKELFEDRKKM